jgi:flagellar biosynthetic protein FliR
VSFQFPAASLVALLLASIRAVTWLMLAPPFNSRAIPTTVKALLALGISIAVVPALTPSVPELTVPAIVFGAVEQVLVGAALGFLTALVFAAVQAAGDLIDLFGGFSVAFAFDPLSLVGNSVFGRFYGLLASTLLFATDAHQLVLRGFTQSYKVLPLDETLSLSTLGRALTTGLMDLFLSALQIAGPLIAVLFCADLGLGLLTRAAPALNPFALGFPAKILLTVTLAGTALLVLPATVDGLVDRAVRLVVGVASR